MPTGRMTSHSHGIVVGRECPLIFSMLVFVSMNALLRVFYWPMSGTPTLGDWIQKITAIRVGLINHNCHSCFECHNNDTWLCGAGGVVTTRRVGRQLLTNPRHVEPHLKGSLLEAFLTSSREEEIICEMNF